MRLHFLPPPAEGTISLGIYDPNRKLVRVLHRAAKIGDFNVEADSLSTTWDGKNDAGEDLPSGKYHARGYLVEDRLGVNDLGKAAEVPTDATDHISVNLIMNPLLADTRSVVDLGIGFDGKGSFVKTMDGLPLRVVGASENLLRALVTKKGDKIADVWEDNGTTVTQFRLTNIDAMMAFDCGDFELK